MSKAMEFILAASRGAKRWNRQAVGGAVRQAIEHHMKFEPGDVTACGRLYSWFDGQPLSLYGQAIKGGNDSFVRAYEQDLEFTPWRWPGCLVTGHEAVDPWERLYVGRDLWFVRDGEMRIWHVSSMDATSLTIVLRKERGERKKCETCGATDWREGREPAKVTGRVTFLRTSFSDVTDRLKGYERAGILDVDGVVAWDVEPVTEGLSADEQAWRGVFLGGKNSPKYGEGRVFPSGVVLCGRGITIHGATVRQARGSRKARLRAFEEAFKAGYRPYHHGSPALTLDTPIPVQELRDVREYYRGDETKIPRLREKLRGRETVTARELLIDATDVERAAQNLAYRVRDMGRAEREAASAAERRAREAVERAALVERLGQYRDVRVTLADSFAVGNCAPGTIDWLSRHFPDALKGVSLDLPNEKLQGHLAKLKRSMTVGQMLENPQVLDSYYARLAIEHAIKREGGNG